MSQSTTILVYTSGTVNAATATALIDTMTGVAAVIPAGGAVCRISIYRDGDSVVSSGCAIQLGVVGDVAKYINVSDAITTTNLNEGRVVVKNTYKDTGLTDETELRITLGAQLSTGSVVFAIKYITY